MCFNPDMALSWTWLLVAVSVAAKSTMDDAGCQKGAF